MMARIGGVIAYETVINVGKDIRERFFDPKEDIADRIGVLQICLPKLIDGSSGMLFQILNALPVASRKLLPGLQANLGEIQANLYKLSKAHKDVAKQCQKIEFKFINFDVDIDESTLDLDSDDESTDENDLIETANLIISALKQILNQHDLYTKLLREIRYKARVEPKTRRQSTENADLNDYFSKIEDRLNNAAENFDRCSNVIKKRERYNDDFLAPDRKKYRSAVVTSAHTFFKAESEKADADLENSVNDLPGSTVALT